ncbi:uncharacterized protein LOC130668894 [Microplitis mediator]|uniref:uncharacterized protein LOC130668894 n=1 Tax=Microplitis mediator TaxID=375433 RepID=UPI002554673E|nr:uncharacterized protein LOC130668894 [Microplitis mediator]
MILLNYFVQIIISFFVIPLMFGESAKIMMEKESTNEIKLSNQTNPQNLSELRICGHDMPCGWYVYEMAKPSFGFDKVFKSFILNKCRCKSDMYRCIRVREILSSQAFTYYCRENTTQYDIYAPNSDIFT